LQDELVVCSESAAKPHAPAVSCINQLA